MIGAFKTGSVQEEGLVRFVDTPMSLFRLMIAQEHI